MAEREGTKRSTHLWVTVDIDTDTATSPDADRVGIVTVNDHLLWQDVYPPGTTHEQVLEDVFDTLGAALRREKGLA